MKRMFLIMGLAAVAAIAGLRLTAADNPCADEMKKAEQLWMNNDYNGSDKVLDEAMQKCPDLAELYWRKARDEYDRIEDLPRDQKPGKDELIKRYRGIEALAAKCMELEPNNGDCWLWKGIGQGRRGTTQGILNSLTEAADLERTFLKSASLKPQYRSANGAANSLGDAYNALGQFYRVLPEWLCTFPFKQLVGTCGDLAKSVEYQRKAVAREPQRIEYQKELGISLICDGQKHDKPEEVTEGKKILNDLQALPEIKKTDPIDKQHAKQILADPSLACGYSRDAQQEQSKEAYKGPQ
jgi:tetratricopeptide (TPR) repeat protein